MKVTLKEKISYGLGDFASSMFWKLFSAYLLFFYTDIVGISAAVVGTMFLITRVWDTLFDPVVGIISDRINTKWGKFRPFILWFAIPFGIIGIFTFTAPDFNYTGKIIYAYITYSLMMMIYSLINVPYASLLGVISNDIKERTTLSTYRFIFAFAGSILVLGTAEPLSEYFGLDENRIINPKQGWQYTIIIYAVLASLMFLITFLFSKERIQAPKEKSSTLKLDIIDLLKNKEWFILLAASVSTLIFNSIRDGSTIFYFKYYINTDSLIHLPYTNITLQYSSAYLVLGQIANIVGVILAPTVANKIGKKHTYGFAMVLATLLSILFYFLDREQLSIIFTLQFLISICAGAIFPLLWSMYADIADYSEWKTGRRATGLIFSSSSMSQKLGWSIGGALTGWFLSAYGFKANNVQNEAAENGLKLMMSIYPAIGAFISFCFITAYKLTDSKIKSINHELYQKKEYN